MSFPIYSVGDSAFLEQVLISVAMVTGSGSITAIASIGLLIAVLIMGFSSVIEGGKAIPFEQLLVGWILYACTFYPTTTVVIEDSYTGSVRPVANVPLGVAVSGFVVSSLGYKLTALFEQGYGFIAPSVTENYFAEPLELISKMRTTARSSAVMDAMSIAGTNNGDLRKSWDNYIRECTLTGIDREDISINDLLKQPMPAALSFSSSTFGTKIYLNGMSGKDVSCSDGFSELTAASRGAIQSNLVDSVFRNMLIENAGESEFSAAGKIESALDMLGAISDDSYSYMLAVVLEPIYEDAAIGRYQDIQDVSSAVMLNQAIQQRNTQWAAEQSMFMSVVRPMQTFFEGFVYAVTPMLAILLVMGKFGIGLAGKYLQTIFWVQLWMPILSIINLYICTAASGQMSSYLMNNELTSMYSINSIDSIMQTWIAAGGMLAAATPVISFFLISGSAYAFTSLAGRLGGADHVDEKTTSSDALKQGPVLQAQALAGHDSFSGTQLSGTEGLVGSMSLGQTLGESVSSASAKQSQASEAFSKQLGRTFGDSASSTETAAKQQALGRTIGAMTGQGAQSIQSAAKAVQKAHNLSDEQTHQIMGQMGMNASGAVSVSRSNGQQAEDDGGSKKTAIAGKGDIGGSASTSDTSTKSNKESASSANNFTDNVSFSEDDQSSFRNELAERFTNSKDSSWSTGLTDSQTKSLTSSAQQAKSATETYNSIDQLAKSAGTASNLNYRALGAAINSSPEAREQLSASMAYAAPETRERANALEDQYRDVYKMSPSVAKSAAGVAALAESKDTNEIKSAVAVANKATGSSISTNANPSYNAGIDGPAQSSNLSNEVNNAVGTGHNSAEGVRNTANNQVAMTPSQHSLPEMSTGGRIEELHHANVNSTAQTADRNDQNISAAMRVRAREQLSEKAESGLDEAAKNWGSANSIGDLLGKHGSNQSGGLLAGIEAFADTLSGSERSGIDLFTNGLKEATAAGTEARASFIEENSGAFTEVMTSAYQNKYGLTDEQANVFASNFSYNNVDKQEAEQNLMAQYENKDEARDMIKVLSHASHDVGQAGSYLQTIQQLNEIDRGVTESRTPPIFVTSGN